MAAGYGEELLGRVSDLVTECTRRVSRSTRSFLQCHHGAGGQRRRKHQTTTSMATAGSVVAMPLCARRVAIDKGWASASSGEALWSRWILMGERCHSLDFADAIHYDSFGRLLARSLSMKSS